MVVNRLLKGAADSIINRQGCKSNPEPIKPKSRHERFVNLSKFELKHLLRTITNTKYFSSEMVEDFTSHISTREIEREIGMKLLNFFIVKF